MEMRWQLARECWEIPREGAIMGILNVTPDSFSDGGRFCTVEKAVQHAELLLREGADVIDIGGESTRPGASPVSTEDEQKRVLPVVRALRECYPRIRLSIDTRHAETARAALLAGADIINDITGLQSPAMQQVCAEIPCGIVLMHMQGTPATMQQMPHYEDVVGEIRRFFRQQMAIAEGLGIERRRICLDPGIGFGKTTEHNAEIIRRLAELCMEECPMMMALSRKRFLGELLGDAAAGKADALPTVVMSLLAADRGAAIHRVHDVAALKKALRLRHALTC